jgi:hypothetical protein
MENQAWLPSESLVKEEKKVVMPFDPAQIGKPADELHLKIYPNSRIRTLVKPYPVSISDVERLCREVLKGVFFASMQKFQIVYQHLPLKVEVENILVTSQSLGDVQKIEPSTKVVIQFQKHAKHEEFETIVFRLKKIEATVENDADLPMDDLIGALHTHSSEGRIFTFEVLKFENVDDYSGQEVGKYLIRDWICNELRQILPRVQLMRGSALKILIEAPLRDFIQPRMQVDLSLVSVSSLGKGKMKMGDHRSSLYYFDSPNYKIDFLEKPNIEIVRHIVDISDPVTVNILEWDRVQFLSKGGLMVVQLSKELILSELIPSLKYFSLKKTRIQTGLGNFLVEFSFKDHHQTDVLYRMANEQNIMLKSEALNLMLVDDEPMNQDQLWQCYLREQLRIRKIGGLSSETMDTMIRFIQKVRMSFNPDILNKNLHPIPLLLISGPTKSGKNFLANFIVDMFSPSMIYVYDSLLKNPCAVKKSEEYSLQQVSRHQRAVLLFRSLENLIQETKQRPDCLRIIVDNIQAAKKRAGLVFIATTSDLKAIPQDMVEEFGDNLLEINLPKPQERFEFLKLLAEEGLPLKDVSFELLTEKTEGFQRRLVADVVLHAKNKAIANTKEALTHSDLISELAVIEQNMKSTVTTNIYT